MNTLSFSYANSSRRGWFQNAKIRFPITLVDERFTGIAQRCSRLLCSYSKCLNGFPQYCGRGRSSEEATEALRKEAKEFPQVRAPRISLLSSRSLPQSHTALRTRRG